MLNRNVGHLMTNPSILLKDGSEIPEGILDAFITTAAAIHDFKSKKNSKTNSVYIVGHLSLILANFYIHVLCL